MSSIVEFNSQHAAEEWRSEKLRLGWTVSRVEFDEVRREWYVVVLYRNV